MFASNKTADVMKGMGIGLAVGTAATVMGSMMMTKSGRKTCKELEGCHQSRPKWEWRPVPGERETD